MKDDFDPGAPDPDPDDEGTAPKKRGRPRKAAVRNKGPYVAATTRKLKQEHSSGLRVLKHAIAEHPGDPFEQLAVFFESFRITAGTGRKRQVSIKTEQRYFEVAPAKRYLMGAMYFGLIVLLVFGMYAAHENLLERNEMRRNRTPAVASAAPAYKSFGG